MLYLTSNSISGTTQPSHTNKDQTRLPYGPDPLHGTAVQAKIGSVVENVGYRLMDRATNSTSVFIR